MKSLAQSWHLLVVLFSVLSIGQSHVFGVGPENLLLVVNSESKESIAVANHFALLRNIPDRNIVLLNSISKRVEINVDEFKTKILVPILDEIKKRNLENQIDMIIYSAGFPTGIRLSEDKLKEFIPKDNQKYFRPRASINAATYFARHVLADKPTFVSLNSNFYYRKNASEVIQFNPFGGEDRTTFADLQAAYSKKSYDEALKLAESLIRPNVPRPLVRFWSAKCLAQLGKIDESIAMLDQAISEGWHFAKLTKSLKEFQPLKSKKEFSNLIGRMLESDRTKVSSFSSSTIWRPDGFSTTAKSEGQRYFLSMVLGVTTDKGNTVEEIVSVLKASAAADNTNPKGTFFFVSNNRIRPRTRAKLIPEAVERLESLGHKTMTIKETLPENQPKVLGLVTGTSKFEFAKCGSKIVPGAICEHLTSTGGVMWGQKGKGQTTVGEFIRYGAAGASGTVVEPYAIAQKFPHPMIHYYYARGCTLIESFYQSVHGPYQLLIVGDPLCKPFGKEVNFNVVGIDESKPIQGQLSVSIEAGSGVQVDAFDLYYDDVLVRSSAAKGSIPFDSTKAKDGYHEFRVVAKTDGPIVFSKTKTFGVYIQNRGKLPRLESTPNTAQLNKSAEVLLSEPIDAELVVRKFGKTLNAKVIKSSKRSSGLSVPCSELGAGPSRLRVYAKKNSTELCLGTITIDVKDAQ